MPVAFSMSHMGTGDRSEHFKVNIPSIVYPFFFMNYGNFSKAVVVESQNICLHKICSGFVYLAFELLIYLINKNLVT